MSQINNVITTQFRAVGGNVVSELRNYGSQFTNLGRSIGDSSRMSERLNSQWRALGTTIRYAIAGSAVFGLTRMVGQLRDVQEQLGLISAIGETASGGAITGGNLNKLFSESRAGAVSAITPINQYNDAVINLLSTVQGIPRDQITPMVTEISRAARLAQVGAEDATKAFTTMNVAFGRPTNLSNIHKMAQEFFIMTREAPGGVAAGQQVITQLGQLAQVTRAAHGTPEDMFAMLLSTLRSGIPPQQAGRGLQYLIQTVAFPGQQTNASRQALNAVGINTNSTMNLQQRLGAIFAHARKLGVSGNMGNLFNADDETMSNLESMDTTQALGSLGISGQGAAYLGTVFRRIHALRTALALEGQLNTGQAQEDLQVMADAANGHVSDINDLSKAWSRFSKQANLQQASIALNAMALQVAQIFEPILNFAAGHISGIQESMSRHPTATKAAALGAGGFLAAMGVGRFFGAGNLPGIRNSKLLSSMLGGTAGRAFIAERSIQAAVSGGGVLGASPQNPMFVIVVGQIFGGGTPGPSDSGNGGIGNTIKTWFGLNAAKALASRAGPGIMTGIRGAAKGAGMFGAEAPMLPDVWNWIAGGVDPTTGQRVSGSWLKRILPIEHGDFKNAQQYHSALARAQKLYPGTTNIADFNRTRGEVYMTIDINQGGKITRRRVIVPVDMWSGGRSPSSGGKSGNARGK